MPDNQQKSMLGCVLWSALGIILYLTTAVVLGIGVRTVAALPAWVGLIKQLEPEEIIDFDAPGVIEVTLNAGPHMIISRSISISYDFEIVSLDNDQPVSLEQETRLIEYELEHLEGRLIYHFNVPKDGRYRITEKTLHDNTLKIAPNYSTRNQIVIALFYGAIGLVGAWLWRRRGRATAIQQQEIARAKSEKWDAFINSRDDADRE